MHDLVALPMHGEIKIMAEGIRTRDGHMMEHFSRSYGLRVRIISRPEPWPRLTLARRHSKTVTPAGWSFSSSEVLALPPLSDRRQWWIRSLRHHSRFDELSGKRVVVWNPISGAYLLSRVGASKTQVLFDVLDDWTVHPLFQTIREEVQTAYRYMFKNADFVTTNSEATRDLATLFGRDDSILIPNGCDIERFSPVSLASGRITVGYGGKLGSRLDGRLILDAADRMPHVDFLFAGPIMDTSLDPVLRRGGNIRYLGDLHYDEYIPELANWDIGWIPHRVGQGEVGGDVIKQYEYRASGLPTFSTPLIGSHRALEGVRVVPAGDLVDMLAEYIDSFKGSRIPREVIEVPAEISWRYKAGALLDTLGIVPGGVQEHQS